MGPVVTVCIPAYQSAHIIRETLDSVRDQSFGDFRVLVSVDQSTDDTAEICRSYGEHDKRFQTVVQSSRLRWAANVNFLLDRVETPYFAILFHDDLWDKDYLRILLGLIKSKQSVVSYSKMERFGQKDGSFSCRSYSGTPFERVHAYLSEPYHAIPLRGLAPSALLKQGFRLREYGAEGFQAERLGVFEMLYALDGVYCPQALYRKRVIENSAVRNWAKWSDQTKLQAWSAHHAAFVGIISGLDLSDAEKQALIDKLPEHIKTIGKAMREPLRALLKMP